MRIGAITSFGVSYIRGLSYKNAWYSDEQLILNFLPSSHLSYGYICGVFSLT